MNVPEASLSPYEERVLKPWCYSDFWNEKASASLHLSSPCSLPFNLTHSSCAIWNHGLPKFTLNSVIYFGILEKSVGCVEKKGLVTRRWGKSNQILRPWPWLARIRNCSFLNILDFSTNHIVVGARGGQPCSKMPRGCINFFSWQLGRQLIYTLPPISFGEKI